MNLALAIFGALDLILRVTSYVIIIQAMLSLLVAFNVLNTSNDFLRRFLAALDQLLEPIYRPIRRVLPDFGGLDFSPLVVLIVIQILRMLLSAVAADLVLP